MKDFPPAPPPLPPARRGLRLSAKHVEALDHLRDDLALLLPRLRPYTEMEALRYALASAIRAIDSEIVTQ